VPETAGVYFELLFLICVWIPALAELQHSWINVWNEQCSFYFFNQRPARAAIMTKPIFVSFRFVQQTSLWLHSFDVLVRIVVTNGKKTEIETLFPFVFSPLASSRTEVFYLNKTFDEQSLMKSL
jgi:hypothetical protein